MNIPQPTTETVNGHVNGKANGHVNGQASKPAPDHVPVTRMIHTEKCAKYFENGRVVTFIFAEQRAWGETEFRVQQVRKGLNGQFSDAFRTEDMPDMIRGAYHAKQWIRKRQRTLPWKVLVAW